MKEHLPEYMIEGVCCCSMIWLVEQHAARASRIAGDSMNGVRAPFLDRTGDGKHHGLRLGSIRRWWALGADMNPATTSEPPGQNEGAGYDRLPNAGPVRGWTPGSARSHSPGWAPTLATGNGQLRHHRPSATRR